MAEETEQIEKPVKRRGRKPAAAKAAAEPQIAAPAANAAKSEAPKAEKPAEPVSPVNRSEPSAPVASEKPSVQTQSAAPAASQAPAQATGAQQNAAQPNQQTQQNAQQQNGQQGGNAQQQLSKKQRWLQQRAQRFQGRNGYQQYRQVPPQMQQVPRNPDLPEYKLADIHSWDNATIVERMCPDANAEDLGAMKRHDIIFNAIRSYLARGGAVMASGCLEIVREGYGYLRSAKTNLQLTILEEEDYDKRQHSGECKQYAHIYCRLSRHSCRIFQRKSCKGILLCAIEKLSHRSKNRNGHKYRRNQ